MESCGAWENKTTLSVCTETVVSPSISSNLITLTSLDVTASLWRFSLHGVRVTLNLCLYVRLNSIFWSHWSSRGDSLDIVMCGQNPWCHMTQMYGLRISHITAEARFEQQFKVSYLSLCIEPNCLLTSFEFVIPRSLKVTVMISTSSWSERVCRNCPVSLGLQLVA